MGAVLVLFAIASIYCLPQADDFAYAYKILNWGLWGAQTFEYMNWNGRFVATFLLSTNPLVWGDITHYRLYPVVLIVLLFLSSVFLMKCLFGKKLVKYEAWFFGLALTFLSIMGFHSIPEGLYWLAGAYTYVMSLVFLNVALGFYFHPAKNVFTYSMASLFAVLLVGSNETVMVLWLYTLLIVEGWHYLETRQVRKGAVVTFIISFIAAIVVIKSPGNSIRAAHFEKSHQVVRTVSNALLYSFIDPIKFLTLPLCVFFLLNFERLNSLVPWRRFYKRRWLSLGLFLGLFFISFAPSLWGMGRRPNARTMNVIVHFYVLSFFPIALMFIRCLPRPRYRVKLIFLLGISLNTYNLVKDFLGPFQNYSWEKITHRQNEVFEAKGLPKSLHFHEVDLDNPTVKASLEHNPTFFGQK